MAWRRRWSLLLGLDRLLALDEPVLADGTVLSAHQVDALSGTLTELLAEVQVNGDVSGDGAVPVLADPAELASAGIPGEEDDDEDEPEEPLDWDDRGELDATPSRSTSSPRTPTPPGASGSSTPPAPARPSPRLASSRPRAPAAS